MKTKKKLTKKQINNVIDFLLVISKDEATQYLLHVLDKEFDMNEETTEKGKKKVEEFIKDDRLRPFYKTIYNHCDTENNDDENDESNEEENSTS